MLSLNVSRPTIRASRKSESVNLRHAAALALVGWYLMTPPRVGDHFFPDAPLSRWRSLDRIEYPSKNACEAVRQKDVAMFPGDPEKLPAERYTARTMMRGVRALACVATDDPPLKEK
jgi:hypothetical protein